MALYRLTTDPYIVFRNNGMPCFIPIGSGTVEAKAYADWLLDGNTPDPYVAPQPSPEDLRDAAFIADSERQTLLDQLRTATVADIKTWVNANVTDLASARVMLRRIVLLLAIAVRR